MSRCHWNSSVPRGAVRTQMFSGTRPPKSSVSAPQPPVQQGGAARVAVEASLERARHQPHLEGGTRGPRAVEGGLAVDGNEAIAAAHLLDEHVLQQVAAHRPLVVGGVALALARDLGRHEGQGVQLRVGVLERRPRLGALVDDQVHEGGVLGVRRDPRPPGRHRAGELVGLELGERGRVARRVDDHLMRSVGGRAAEELRLRR